MPQNNFNFSPLTDKVIGLVGMGSYATLHFFHQFLALTPASKEWDRPRIIIDNNCVMPSRVRAILYGENRKELVRQLTQSIQLLIDGGATQIILLCNTAHVFLDEIYDLLPAAKNYVVNIIETLCNVMRRHNISNAVYIGSEGTVASGIFENVFSQTNITLNPPPEGDFAEMRCLIESVKQNSCTLLMQKRFIDLVTKEIVATNCSNVILGCTEFPVLYDLTKDAFNTSIRFWNPLTETLNVILHNTK